MTYNKPPSGDALHGTCHGSAESEKPGGPPEPSSTPIRKSLVQCNAKDGPLPKVGGIVWMWHIWEEKWQLYHVVRLHSDSPYHHTRWVILNANTGFERLMTTNKLYVCRT